MCQGLIYLLMFKTTVMGMYVPEKSMQDAGPYWADLFLPTRQK